MVTILISFLLLLLFAEMSSANFKRLAPMLEAWDQAKTSLPVDPSQFLWKGGWEKLATVIWAVGTAIPVLAFATGCKLYISDDTQMGNLVVGTAVGSNIIGLSLIFGLALLSGPITFFRIRTITSPVFLLLATVVFTMVCLNKQIGPIEGFFLISILVSYGFYFRRFSSEWKFYERTYTQKSLVESSDGILPILSILSMGIGFFLLAVVVSFPFIQKVQEFSLTKDSMQTGMHFVSLALSLPWIIRCIAHSQSNDTAKAITLTGISHTCLLNILLVPAVLSIFYSGVLSVKLVGVYLPVLLVLTGTYVSALLIEKESGGWLTWILIISYVVYTGLGVAF